MDILIALSTYPPKPCETERLSSLSLSLFVKMQGGQMLVEESLQLASILTSSNFVTSISISLFNYLYMFHATEKNQTYLIS